MRYCSCHENIKFELTCNVLFILLTAFLTIFRRFPNVFQNCSEGQTNVPENFEEDPKMFRLYTYEFKYNLRDKLDISEISDIFTSEDTENMRLESRM